MSDIHNPEPAHAPEREELPFERFFRAALRWRTASRLLFVGVCLATLVALFYAVENWRGRRAWEECRRGLEAKGEVIDWDAYIPAPVPEAQNIYKAPRIAEWFVKGSLSQAVSRPQAKPGSPSGPFNVLPRKTAGAGPLLVAEVQFAPTDKPLPPGKPDAVLRLDDPAAPERAARLIRGRVACAEGAQGYIFTTRPLEQIHPVYLVVQADKVPSVKALSELLPQGLVPRNGYSSTGPQNLHVEAAGGNGFLVTLKADIYTPSEYLELSQPAAADFDVLRKAVERPCARMDGDYQRPFDHPVPNFVQLRTVAQVLSQRAQCYLLLGQSEAAWRELALVRDMCRMMEAKPASDCPTLVEAMIDVAITGLYVSVIQDGFRLQVWREPELAAMQQQLAEVNFLPLLYRAFHAERAATCRTFEMSTPAELRKLFAFDRASKSLWDKLQNPTFLLITFAPRGWFYQNMCAGTRLEQPLFDTFDAPNNQVRPGKLADFNNQAEAMARRPYSFLAAKALPNFVKAAQTMARNQTLANEAYLACGLARYHLAHGEYPKTLEALVPQFAQKAPRDIVGGEALKYVRTADGQFELYSIGWNGKDDGGFAGKTVAEGDWVWQ
jgi:hypothetical protein